jgi:hypothetical protein
MHDKANFLSNREHRPLTLAARRGLKPLGLVLGRLATTAAHISMTSLKVIAFECGGNYTPVCGRLLFPAPVASGASDLSLAMAPRTFLRIDLQCCYQNALSIAFGAFDRPCATAPRTFSHQGLPSVLFQISITRFGGNCVTGFYHLP